MKDLANKYVPSKTYLPAKGIYSQVYTDKQAWCIMHPFSAMNNQ